jgi:DNA-binding MarR family transcriptional regulator
MHVSKLLKITHGAMNEPALAVEDLCILAHLYSMSAAIDFGDLSRLIGGTPSFMSRRTDMLTNLKLTQKARSAKDDRKVLMTITEAGCKRLRDLGVV